MTKTSSRETAFAKPALSAAVILLRFAVLLLVVISMDEVLGAISGLIYDIKHKHEMILLAALIALSVPAGGVLVWGCRAVFMAFEKSLRIGYRYFRNYRDNESPTRGGDRAKCGPAPHPAEPPEGISGEPGTS
jgi:hypothetical protein